MQTVWSDEAWIFFGLFAFVTTYFTLNLTLAVIEESYSNEKQKLDQQHIDDNPKIYVVCALFLSFCRSFSFLSKLFPRGY
jgi:hypothetical protein